ncbi:hypothetical protein FAGAP_5467 [Fusarium agapanthi]|uniref:Uncharacterized protein n=1 Tax=Fusarium agapanthi TaxID=1803897 RepID=A0A9P5BBS7_9HYPO|nr:hypothetical protein FAGAP_5467 [Fusarium agapanthi]
MVGSRLEKVTVANDVDHKGLYSQDSDAPIDWMNLRLQVLDTMMRRLPRDQDGIENANYAKQYAGAVDGNNSILLQQLEGDDSEIDWDWENPYILCVFLQNQQRILRPLRKALNNHFPGQNLTQAALVCRLRHMEDRLQGQGRAQIEQVMKPVLTSPPEPIPVSKLNLGGLSELYGVLREADTVAACYPNKAWIITQELQDRRVDNEDLPKLPLSLPLSDAESQQMQKAYLVFDAYRHTLCFSTSLLQDYGHEDSPSSFHIPLKSIYEKKLLWARDFQAVFVFLFKEYESLLNQIHDRNTGPPSLPRSTNNDVACQRPLFADTSRRDRLQLIAYLCSQGYHQILIIRERSSSSQDEHILSMYRQYQALKGDRLSCPMVVGADLEHSLKTLCCNAGEWHEFWTSGAYMWDMERS